MVWPEELLNPCRWWSVITAVHCSLLTAVHRSLFGIRCFSTSYLYSFLQSCEVGIISSILQMRKAQRG